MPNTKRSASKLRQQMLVLGQLLETTSDTNPARNQATNLMREDLPKLVNAFVKIPKDLRNDDHLGQTPAEMLEAGLRRVSLKAEELTNQLKKESFDALAVHVGYLGYQTDHADGSNLKPGD